MLKTQSITISRVSSFNDLPSRVESSPFHKCTAITGADHALAGKIIQFLSSHQGSISNEAGVPRERSNSTILPTRSHVEIKVLEQEKKLNLFDQSPYKEVACQNKKFEARLGESLSCNKELVSMAKKIREVTGSPMLFKDFSPEQQQKIKNESGFIGGAKELMNDVDSLDAHVLATLIKAEGKEYNVNDRERRQCMFNHVRSPDNPIYPWNDHSFDMEIFEVKNPIQFTEQMRNLISDRWSDLLKREVNLEDYLYGELGISPIDLRVGIMDIIQGASESDRKKLLKEALRISWSTSEFVADENNSRDSNPLGSEFRQHTTGARSNVVRVSDKNDPNVNKWVFEAVVNNKPVTSGPSGHTLRYLNHYAMCSEMLQLSNSSARDLPSLKEARLVMLANLIAPKDHHSYHEIMLASIGVYNGDEMLEYRSKDSYDDLKSTRVGSNALVQLNVELHSR